MVYDLQGWILNTFGAAAIILLSCIITSFFIPNMLRKGTVDLLLAKPIRRWALLSYKYVGGLTFMFVNTAVIVVGFWLVMGLRAGIWEPAMLLSILVLTFEFALFYAVSTLLAVLTRNPVVSILGCILLWALLLPVGLAYWFAGRLASTDSGERPWHVTAINVVHAVLPRYKDLDVLGEKTLYLAMHDPSPAQQKAKEEEYRAYYWDETILVNGIWIALLLGLACWRFQVRDY
jgi:ABC-type transport system involved in multi-copper enzyme maturation permease subunit